jgi:hypothetical protein
MYAAKRQMQQDDLSKAFERFNRLSPETAQRVVRFHERRIKLRDESKANEIRPTKQTAKAGASPSPTDAHTTALIGSTA